MKPGYQTTEFWLSIASTVVGLVAVVIGLSPADTATVSQAVSTAIVAVGSLVTSALTVYSYIRARTDLKVEALYADTDGDGLTDDVDDDDDGDGIPDAYDHE